MRRANLIRLLFALSALQPLCVQAQATNHPCPASAGHFCNLGGYLHGLYAVAAVLAVILIVVVVAAIAYYRKAKRMKLEP